MMAIVAANFTFVLGYLSFVAIPPWNLNCVVVFSIAFVATLCCWCMTFRAYRKQRVSPPAPIPDGKSESYKLTN